MKITGAQAIIKSLIAEDCKFIFGYPGGAIMPTYDALFDKKRDIHHILVRHEQGAVHSAVGFARATNKVGVVIATSGPGATNLVTGIADAFIDSVPLVCITGQVASHLLGTDAFQEADILSITMPITKWSCQIIHAHEIPSIIRKAFTIASEGRKGPVLIDITKDAQINSLIYDDQVSSGLNEYIVKNSTLSKDLRFIEEIKESAKLINNARRPIIIAGQGVMAAKAEEILKKIAQKANIPVVNTLLGLSSFPNPHPLYKGMLGMHGNYSSNLLCNKSDVVLAIGMRFDDRVTGNLSKYLKESKIIHIEIDISEINKNVEVDYFINSDAKKALEAMFPYIESNKHEKWLSQFDILHKKEEEIVINDEIYPKKGKIRMAEVVFMLSNKTKGKAIIVSDVGQHQMIAARYYKFHRSNGHISSGGLGTMGFALPAAIGAKIGVGNKREVISIIGDGSFQMNLQELAVLNQEQISVKIIILNNNYLGMVRQWQQMFYEKRYSSTEISSPDFIKLAEAYGIKSDRVSNREHVSTALDKMLDCSSSYLLEIMVEKQDNVFPMVPQGASISETLLYHEA